jgi:DNA helicase II / ATP-dependent DNA helicase PcrA
VLGLLEGVGPATTRTILERLALPNAAAVRTLVDDPPPVPARGRADLDLLRELLGECLELAQPAPPAVEIELLRSRARPLFERRYAQARARLTDLEQLQGMAASCPTRAHFLAELTIDPPNRTSDLAGPPLLDDDYVILSTIHSAKGGEWTAVYVIHASDGNIPSDMSLSSREGLDEERRLFYVALTRARDHLYVTYPQRFYDRRHGLDDAHSFGQPSRFLAGTDALFADPASDHGPVLAGDTAVEAGPDTVADQLSSLWT